MPDKNDILDLYFMDARSKLIDIAAFLDRVDRHEGDGDFRHAAFLDALEVVKNPNGKPRAQALLECLSDPTMEPLDSAGTKGAAGAYEG